MSYLAGELVTRAWYLSGIVARNLQQVSGDQMQDGLKLLNFLLGFKASDLDLIPYWTRDTLALTQGTEMYFVENLYAIETMTFNIGTVRYSMIPYQRKTYFGSGRVDDIQSLPFQYHVERVEGGSNVYVYFTPNQSYTANYSGKFALTEVTLVTDLQTVYDNFYIEYLRHALAQYMCNEYNTVFQPGPAAKLAEIVSKLQTVSPKDLTTSKISTLRHRTGLNWGDINIGVGYRPI